MLRWFLSFFLLSSLLAAADEKGVAFFESKVRPLLVQHCYECHSAQAGKQKGGLSLDNRQGWQKGGDAGPALVPGKPKESLLLHSVRYEDEDLQMPPKSKLPAEAISTFEQWIALGAPDPRTDAAVPVVATKKPALSLAAARQTWAFREHQKVAVPAVKNKTWPYTAEDAFLLSEMEAHGLSPAADAEPRKLLRRLCYDLTGLPPSAELSTAYLSGSMSYPQLVDTLLHSPDYGAKWGRLWLDLARYSDSNGGDRNYTFYQAWRYRNYVVDAFNNDKSFYDFVKEQIAGDLLPAASTADKKAKMIATTFLALGPKMLTERDKEKLHLDTADEQLDTLGKAFLGLSLGCARCHDHKFDPVSQRDYYAMAGILRSTQVVLGTRNGCVNVASWVEQPLPQPEPAMTELRTKVERLELTMRLKVERDFMQKVGGKKAVTSLPFAGVILDDGDAELKGNWKESQLEKLRLGVGYLHDDREGKGSKSALFRTSVPETGEYEVRLAYPSKGKLGAQVPVLIETQDKEHRVLLDQRQTPSIAKLFQPVGRFHFEKGGRAHVTVSTEGTQGFVLVDAVQFIAVRDIQREATALAMHSGEKSGDPLLKMQSKELEKEVSKQVHALKDAELSMSPRDAEDAGDIHLRVRGEVGQLGPKVPRGFMEVLHAGPAPRIPAGASGRLQLAEWLVSQEVALLDRVIVNRVWAGLFGRGIVRTVDNFGAQGTVPSHPALLEHVATEFRQSGGSVKELVRRLVSSRSYQLAAEGKSARVTADPENTWFSRRAYRRLTADELRDSLLYFTGDLEQYQPAATANRYGEDLDDSLPTAELSYRSVYLPIARNNLAPELELFDAPNPEMTAGERPFTTVPTQALYLLNSSFMRGKAKTLAELGYAQEQPIDWLYERVLGHAPSAQAKQRAEAFLMQGELEDLAQVLLASAEFLFLE